MRTRYAGAWRVVFGVQIVTLAVWLAAGCDSSQLLGETCADDDECISGAICRGGECMAPIDIGRDPWQAGDAAPPPDAADDVATDAEQDAAPETAPDAPQEAAADAPQEAAADDAGDAGDGG